MSKDSNRTYVHLNQPRVADLFEDFCRDHLPDDEVYVPPHHQPINPEDEDDGLLCPSTASGICSNSTATVVPDQHAAFGITRAQQKTRDPAWKDLGLSELLKQGPKGVGKEAQRKAGSTLPR